MPERSDATPTEPGEVAESASRPTECRVCGSEIDLTAWHPVATRIDDDGEFHLYVFCSAGCRNRWTDG